jgi:hypothetical protein
MWKLWVDDFWISYRSLFVTFQYLRFETESTPSDFILSTAKFYAIEFTD